MEFLSPWLSQKRLVPIFFIVLFLVGLLGYEQYGVHWDEPNMIRVGEESYAAVFEGQPWPTADAQRYYGTTVELPLSIIRHQFNITETRDIFLMRHFVTFLLFIVGAWFFYRLVERRTGSWQWGLLGALFLTLSPRIFADAFYNSKDVPAMIMFIIAAYTLTSFLKEPTWKRLIWHAVGTALVISVRITGILIPAFTLLFLFQAFLRDRRGETLKQSAVFAAGYMALATVLTIAVWPFLWEQPLAHFLEAYRFMSSIGIDTFYMGEQIHALPWHYVFVWIGITTPLLYSLLFFIGLAQYGLRAVRRPIDWVLTAADQQLPLLWLFTPIAAVYASGAGIFDGWRHLYFVYPAFLLIAIDGLRWTWQWLASRSWATTGTRVAVGSLALHSLYLIGWMAANHPLQNVYFSIPDSYAQGNFELDYWGLSFRKAIEWVAANDPDPTIPIWANISPGFSTHMILPKDVQSRITYDEQNAKYLLTNYRFHYKDEYPHELAKAFYAGGVRVIGVYKLR